MRALLIVITAAFMAGCAYKSSAPQSPSTSALVLVRIADGGREFVEIERMPSYSAVEVRGAPAGSVPSSMFALRGSCAVARSRGAKFFASTQLPGPVATYRLTFPDSATDAQLRGTAKSVFSISECDALRF